MQSAENGSDRNSALEPDRAPHSSIGAPRSPPTLSQKRIQLRQRHRPALERSVALGLGAAAATYGVIDKPIAASARRLVFLSVGAGSPRGGNKNLRVEHWLQFATAARVPCRSRGRPESDARTWRRAVERLSFSARRRQRDRAPLANECHLAPHCRGRTQSAHGIAEMRGAQLRSIETVAQKADALAEKWAHDCGGMQRTLQELNWFFDVLTQNGSMRGIWRDDYRALVATQGERGAISMICGWLENSPPTWWGHKDCVRNAAL
jgi:hypothetical protein